MGSISRPPPPLVGNILATSVSVDFNAANTDTVITLPALPVGYTRYAVQACRISGASAAINTATVGLFTAAAGGGTAIVSAASAVTITTASENTNNNTQAPTIANIGTQSYNVLTLYFRVATPQGSAATANVTIYIVPLP